NLHDKFTLTGMEANFFWLLKIVGVGYKARAETEGLLYLKLGDVHHAELTVPLRIFCLKNSVVCTQFAASVHSRKPNEPLKRKRIMYADEVIKRKVGRKEQIDGENNLASFFNTLHFGSINPASLLKFQLDDGDQ
ncbi:hypothetical protein CICLE_v10030364mg, partial [Citrus x clementina]